MKIVKIVKVIKINSCYLVEFLKIVARKICLPIYCKKSLNKRLEDARELFCIATENYYLMP